MTTPHPAPRRIGRRTAAALTTLAVAAFVLAACGGAAAPDPTAPPAPGATPRPTPTAVPGDPGNGGSGGGSGGNPGGGIIPVPIDPNLDPMLGNATYVTPGTNLVDPRPVNVQLVRAFRADDGTVTADLRWWSGVAPCSQLDHVDVVRDDGANTIRFTVVEGSGRGDIACDEMAQLKATTVDLGVLASGTWKLSADGDAPTITLDVP